MEPRDPFPRYLWDMTDPSTPLRSAQDDIPYTSDE